MSRRSTVQAVDRAIVVLDVLAGSRGALPVKDIADRAGLDRTTTHRLLRTLSKRDLVEATATGWRLGIGTFRLGRIYLDSLPFTAVAPAFALDLFSSSVKDRPWSVVVALLMDDGAAIVDRYWSDTAPLSTVLDIGTILPLDRSATGLAILSHLSDDQIRARLGPERSGAIADQIAAVREAEGVACFPNLVHHDVHAVACAIRSPDGIPIGAINVNGIEIDDQLRPDSPLALAVRRAAQRISSTLRGHG